MGEEIASFGLVVNVIYFHRLSDWLPAGLPPMQATSRAAPPSSSQLAIHAKIPL
jgi:hypothetical protein